MRIKNLYLRKMKLKKIGKYRDGLLKSNLKFPVFPDFPVRFE
jgi:hypothetical protein